MPPETGSRQALDAAHLVVWEWDRDAGLRWEGDPEAVTGRSVEELPLDLPGCDIVAGLAHPDDRDGVARLCRASAEMGDVIDVEFRCPGPGGDRWLALRGEIERAATQAPSRARGVLFDVTAARTARQQAEQERDWLAESQAVAHLGTWEWDIPTGAVRWSENLYRMLGLEPGEIEPSYPALLSIFFPADVALVEAAVERALETGERVDFVVRVVRRDREIRWFRCRGQVSAGPAGAPARMVGTALDVTEARATEEALRNREEQLRQRAEQQEVVAHLGVLALKGASLDQLFADAVSCLADTLGVELTKILELEPGGRRLLLRAGVGWRPGAVGHATVDAGSASQAGYTLASEEPVIVEDLASETRFRGPALLFGHGVVSGMSVIIHGQRRPFGVLGAHTTRPRRFTAEDVAFLQSVANVVAASVERHEVEEEKRRVEAELERARGLESLGRLAGGVAHDFNNILTLILGYGDEVAQAVQSGLPTGDATAGRALADLGEVREAAERGAALTRQLLTFARQDRVRPEAIELGTLLEEVAAHLQTVVGSAVELRQETAGGLWPVVADRAQLEQLLVNLALNAREAMTEGGVVAFTAANTEMQGRPAVRLEVRDTGSGMAPEVAARAFEPFFTTKPPGKGAGLGLATVHAVVSQAGGGIGIDTAPGAGTTVWIELPAQAGAVPAPSEGEPAGGDVLRSTVLVVDDEPALLEMARRILVKAGYRVLEAADPAAALEICRREGASIDMLLTDVVMPGMSGPELAREVQGLQPGIAVVFMSGFAGDHLDPGEQPLLRKPFTSQELLEALQRAGRTPPGH